MHSDESAGQDACKLRIAAFPTGPDIWRVDWFGPIAFPDRMLRRRHPSVLVYLPKVTHPQALTDPAVLLQPDCTLPADRQIKRGVSVGTTMLLRIGDLWQDQTLVARPAYESFMMDDLLVDRETATLVKAGSSFDDGSFLLPLTEHPWHRANTHSYCVRLALPGERFLVVPCMEMARFYFGSSSELLSRLFQPPLTKDRLFGQVSSDDRSRMRLVLAERVPRASAEDVARIAGSDAAWKAAMLISVSCLKASAAGKEAYPQAVFPFEGVTGLQAIGRWLPGGQEHAGAFLAYQLLTCAHPFPFRSLHVKVSGGRPQRTKPATDDITAALLASQISASQPKNPLLQERDPSAQLAAATFTVSGRRRFPDLARKPTHAVRDSATPVTIKPLGGASAVENLAIGEPGSEQQMRPTSLVDDRSDETLNDPPDFLHHVVSMLRALDGTRVELLTKGGEDAWTVPVPLIADEDGVIDSALLIQSEQCRPRRVAVFSLIRDSQHQLLVIVECNILLPLLYSVIASESDIVLWSVRKAAMDFSKNMGNLVIESSNENEINLNTIIQLKLLLLKLHAYDIESMQLKQVHL